MMITAPDAKPDGSGDNLLPGRVVDIVNMGAHIHYIIEAADGRIMALEPNRELPRVRNGDRVCVRFRAEDGVVLPHASG
ncbi:MAG: TOBE domain-containing protein [Alphaproteobacteria bacterium]|nr:TOBE domain-containing protein [Alphaproteobacteria bacterium]